MSMPQQQQFETGGRATGYETGQFAQRGGQMGTQGMGQQPTGQQQTGQQPIGQQQMGQQPIGQQPTGQQQTGQQQMGQQPATGGEFESSLTNPMRIALHDFVESLTACDYCADRCIDEGPEMAECIRLCRDVSDLAALNIQLMARDSIFGPEAAEVFAEAARECARECARHPHAHCQECAAVLSRAADSTWQMLESFQGGMAQPGGQQQAGQQAGGTQFGQGQTGQYGAGQPQQY